jgi:DHA1 family bicyclomycin/chloramphenicol resistance-like MFS transporter
LRRRLPTLPYLVALNGLMPLGMQGILPALPAMAADLHTSASVIQWAVTLYMIAVGVSQLAYGPVSDLYGRRPLVLFGIVVFAIGSVICALSTSVEMVMAGRLVQGIGACTGVVLGRAMVRDVFQANRATTMLAYMSMALMAFPGIAPIVGGFILEIASWRVLLAAMSLCAVVLFAISLPLAETNQSRTKLPTLTAFFRDLASLVRNPEFLRPAVVSALSSGGFFSFLSISPIMAKDILHVSPERYGLYFVIVPMGFFLGSFLSTRIIPRFGPERSAIGATVLASTSGAVLIGLAIDGRLTPLSLFLPVSFLNIFWGIAQPALTVAAISASPRLIGTASGFLGFMQMMSGAAGTQIVAHWYDRTAVPGAVMIAGASMIGLAIQVRHYVRHRRR